MNEVDLLMPMAGRGSRFARMGMLQPKPLLPLEDRPFFWWAVESLRRVASVRNMVFVVLQQHIEEWQIDQRIHEFYRDAKIVAIPDVTSGSAETAFIAASALEDRSLPIAVNDCDHAFVSPSLDPVLTEFAEGRTSGALMTFTADSPNYSYVELSPEGKVIGTVEKKVVSPYAITGCYLFSSATKYLDFYRSYVDKCPYDELFLSGIYNEMIAAGESLDKVVLEQHFAFGTPEEYNAVQPRLQHEISFWKDR